MMKIYDSNKNVKNMTKFITWIKIHKCHEIAHKGLILKSDEKFIILMKVKYNDEIHYFDENILLR